MPRPRQGWGSRWRACCGRPFAREGTLRKSVRRDGAKTASARGEANEAVRRMIQYGENRVRAGRRLSNRLPRARRAPPRRREIVKKSLRLAARACHLLSICYDGSAAAAGPPPRMAARGTRRGDARAGAHGRTADDATPRAGRPREREATVQMHGQRDRVRDARGSGKPSPHGGCATPRAGRPREREPAAARRPHGPGTGGRPRVMRGAAARHGRRKGIIKNETKKGRGLPDEPKDRHSDLPAARARPADRMRRAVPGGL